MPPQALIGNRNSGLFTEERSPHYRNERVPSSKFLENEHFNASNLFSYTYSAPYGSFDTVRYSIASLARLRRPWLLTTSRSG
jgi:hypothetical protein